MGAVMAAIPIDSKDFGRIAVFVLPEAFGEPERDELMERLERYRPSSITRATLNDQGRLEVTVSSPDHWNGGPGVYEKVQAAVHCICRRQEAMQQTPAVA